MTAAPTPWTARAAISSLMPGARAAAAEDAVKMVRPTRKSRRRPKRSPSEAPNIRMTAKVSVYAFTVHSRSDSAPPRSSRMEGSAVVTTRLSSAAMNPATLVMISAQAALAGRVLPGRASPGGLADVPFIGSSPYGLVIDD